MMKGPAIKLTVVFVMLLSIIIPALTVEAVVSNTYCTNDRQAKGLSCHRITDNEIYNLNFKAIDSSAGYIDFKGYMGIDYINVSSRNSRYNMTFELNDVFPDNGKVVVVLSNNYVVMLEGTRNSVIEFKDLVTSPLMVSVHGHEEGLICSRGKRDYNVDFAFVIDTSGSMTTNDPKFIRVKSAKDFLDTEGVIEDDRFSIVTFAFAPVSYIVGNGGIEKTRRDGSSYSQIISDKVKVKSYSYTEPYIKPMKYFRDNSSTYRIYDAFVWNSNTSTADRRDYFTLENDYELIKRNGINMFTKNKSHAKTILDDIKSNVGGTNIGIGLREAVDNLNALNEGNEKVIILLTDGKHNTAYNEREMDNFTLDQAVLAKESGVVVYTIGLGEKRELNEDLMKNIANETGGEYFHAYTSSDLEDIYRRISEITKCEIIGHNRGNENIEGINIIDSCIMDDSKINWIIESSNEKNHKVRYSIFPSNEEGEFSIPPNSIVNLVTNSGGYMKLLKGNNLITAGNSKNVMCNAEEIEPIELVCAPPPNVRDRYVRFPEEDYSIDRKIFIEESIIGNSYFINTRRNNSDDNLIPKAKGILF